MTKIQNSKHVLTEYGFMWRDFIVLTVSSKQLKQFRIQPEKATFASASACFGH